MSVSPFFLHTIIFNSSSIVTAVSMVTTIPLDGGSPLKKLQLHRIFYDIAAINVKEREFI